MTWWFNIHEPRKHNATLTPDCLNEGAPFCSVETDFGNQNSGELRQILASLTECEPFSTFPVRTTLKNLLFHSGLLVSKHTCQDGATIKKCLSESTRYLHFDLLYSVVLLYGHTNDEVQIHHSRLPWIVVENGEQWRPWPFTDIGLEGRVERAERNDDHFRCNRSLQNGNSPIQKFSYWNPWHKEPKRDRTKNWSLLERNWSQVTGRPWPKGGWTTFRARRPTTVWEAFNKLSIMSFTEYCWTWYAKMVSENRWTPL